MRIAVATMTVMALWATAAATGLDSILSGITEDHVQVLDVPQMLARKLR